MRQTWSKLLFAHWRVPGDYMRDLVPEQLEIDTFDGSAWIAVVPFLMSGIRLRYLPPVPPTHQSLELNVRTYVRYGGRPGVFFFSLDAQKRIIVETARRWFHLPYHHAAMRMKRETYVRYESTRTHLGSPGADLQSVYRPVSEPVQSRPGSVEYFLTERYCLYAIDPFGRVLVGEIDHEPWRLQRAEGEFERNTMTEDLGVELRGAPLLHYSDSIDVKLWTPVAAESYSEVFRDRAPDR
jgi:uncharacterized protein YqjF (DUF2071 family)